MTQAARQLDLLEISAPSKPKIVRAPDIRFAPPSAPGSKSSEDAADLVERSPFRRKSLRRIVVVLAAIPEGSVLSREEISARTGIKDCSMCGRLSDLYRLPVLVRSDGEKVMWVEAVESAVVASSGKLVNGYRLTPAARLATANQLKAIRENGG